MVQIDVKKNLCVKAQNLLQAYRTEAQYKCDDRAWQECYAQRSALQQIYNDFRGTQAEKQEVYDYVVKFQFNGFLYPDPSETAASYSDSEESEADTDTTVSSSDYVEPTKKQASSSCNACSAIAAVVVVVAAVVIANL